MNRMLILCLLAFAALGCEKKQDAPVPPAAQVIKADHALTAGEDEQVLAFDIEGMTCNSCINTIQTTLAELPGVKGIGVSLDENKAWVLTDTASALSPQRITDTLKPKGYTATAITN